MSFVKYLLFCVLFSVKLFGQKTFFFNDSLKIESLVPYIQKMEGMVGDTVSFSNITTQKFKQIQNSKMGKSHGEYWFRFKVQNTYPKEQLMAIYMKGMSMKKFDIYKEIEGVGLTKIKTLKKGLTLKNRIIPHKYEETLLLEPHLTTSYYINVFFPKSVILPLKAGKIVSKSELDQTEYAKQGIYYGIAMMVLVLNLFLFRSLKDISYFYYASLLVSFVLIIAVLDGVIYTLLSEIMNLFIFDFILHFIGILFLVLFSIQFLDLKSHIPKYVKFIYTMTFLMGVFYTVYFFTDNSLWFIYGEFTGVVVIFLCCLSGFIVINKSKFANFFVLAYGFLIVMFLLYSISIYINDSGIRADLDYLKVGSIVEMFILTYAVSYRFKLLEKDKLIADKTVDTQKKELESLENKIDETKLLSFIMSYNFSNRETEVLRGILLKQTNPEIAQQLFISLPTVKFHVSNILKKVHVKNRKELIETYVFSKSIPLV